MRSSADGLKIALDRIDFEMINQTGFLDLGMLGLKEIPEELWKLEHLTGLNLGKLWPVGGERYGAATADLKANEFETISAQPHGKLPNLRFLSLYVTLGCPDFWKILECFGSLEILDCQNSNIPNLDPLRHAKKLSYLDCGETEISSLRPIAEHPALEYLSCESSSITSLEPISRLFSLRTLNIRYCNVSSLEPISAISNLESLEICSSGVVSLEPLSGLRNLINLSCSYTEIESIRPLSHNTLLETLSCGSTGLTSLEGLENLPFIKAIYATKTGISSLAPLSGLASLEILEISGSKIQSIEPLAGMPLLHRLCIGDNPVKTLKGVEHLPSLKTLDCKKTGISDLNELRGSFQLEFLNCSSTDVASLEPLCDLNNISVLFCDSCKITHIPPEIIFIDALDTLDLYGNPLGGIPPEISFHSVHALRAHFRDLQAGDALLKDTKVILLGNGRIGKTQFCGLFKGGSYDADSDSTHGIMVTDQDLEDGSRLHWWDFGGQEIYHGTHTLFMRTRALFIVLWTPESENSREHEWNGMTFRNHPLDYWIELVQQLAGADSPLLIVQCRCDSPKNDIHLPPVNEHLLGKFTFLKILQHSSATYRGMGAARDALSDAVRWIHDKQGQIRIGAGRMRVKTRLESMRADDAARPANRRMHRLLSQEEFSAICEEEGEVSSPEYLLTYLHECGVVFYREGLFLGKIILDQSWALDAIYTIFHREKCWWQIRSRGGIFNRRLLKCLAWEEHTEEEQNLFFSMMKSCGLCFTLRYLDDGESEYIAPDLLPPEEIIADALEEKWGEGKPDQSRNYEFPYEYPGLVTSVISAMGSLAGIGALYWKDGFCGYERKSRSRILIRRTTPFLERKEMHLQIAAKGPGATDLIGRIVQTLEQVFHDTGCRQWKSMGEDPDRKIPNNQPAGIRSFGDGDNMNSNLDFVPEPRRNCTYAVSYKRGGKSERIAIGLCAQAKLNGIDIMRDTNTVRLGQALIPFMASLTAQDHVYIILSRGYLESYWCIYELLETWRGCGRNTEVFNRKVRPCVLEDASISTAEQREAWADYWMKQALPLDASVREKGLRTALATIEDGQTMIAFAEQAPDILKSIATTVHARNLDELLRNDFRG